MWNFPLSVCLRVGFWRQCIWIWILGSKLILSNNQSRATLWVLDTCLIVGFLPFMIILITASLSSKMYNKASFWVEFTFEEIKSTFSRSSIFPWIFFRVGDFFGLTVLDHSHACFREELRRSDPINQAREYRPTLILHPKRWFLILLSSAKLKFVSYTSNILEEMYDFQKRTMFLQKWILNLQDLPRSQSLETVPICIVWQYFPHDNIVCTHSYDEKMKSIDSGVCHWLWSILWWILQVCSLTIEYLVVQSVPSISISEQFESIHVTILLQISNLLLWSGGHRCMEYILCRVVESSCLPTHSIFPHISWHDLPDHKAMKNAKILRVWKLSGSTRGNSRFKHGSVVVRNIFTYFTLSLSAAQVYMIQERCWFSHIDSFVEKFPHRINLVFLSSQFDVIHIHR